MIRALLIALLLTGTAMAETKKSKKVERPPSPLEMPRKQDKGDEPLADIHFLLDLLKAARDADEKALKEKAN